MINSIEKSENIANIIVEFQSCIRGYLTRKILRKNKDSITYQMIDNLINVYNNYCNEIEKFNQSTTKRKARKPNFPSEISENLVKYYIAKKFNVMGTWENNLSGDLKINNKTIEVKAFVSDGPSSFGPDEKWDLLYFVDCREIQNNKIKIYFVDLSNNSDIWKSIKVNKKETIGDQSLVKRRPRINFIEIKKQIPNNCFLVFDGYVTELF